jgi:hypothetical protein
MTYPSFLEHLRARYGCNWCVAHRASGRTAQYDVVLTPKRYAMEQSEWASKHPAWILANTLPEGEEKRFILKAVQSRLGTGS